VAGKNNAKNSGKKKHPLNEQMVLDEGRQVKVMACFFVTYVRYS